MEANSYSLLLTFGEKAAQTGVAFTILQNAGTVSISKPLHIFFRGILFVQTEVT